MFSDFLIFGAKVQKIFGFCNTYLTFFTKNEGLQSVVPQKYTFFVKKCTFLEADSTTRANVSAGSALCANVRINGIVFAFRNCAHRALIDTGTASDTIG